MEIPRSHCRARTSLDRRTRGIASVAISSAREWLSGRTTSRTVECRCVATRRAATTSPSCCITEAITETIVDICVSSRVRILSRVRSSRSSALIRSCSAASCRWRRSSSTVWWRDHASMITATSANQQTPSSAPPVSRNAHWYSGAKPRCTLANAIEAPRTSPATTKTIRAVRGRGRRVRTGRTIRPRSR